MVTRAPGEKQGRCHARRRARAALPPASQGAKAISHRGLPGPRRRRLSEPRDNGVRACGQAASGPDLDRQGVGHTIWRPLGGPNMDETIDLLTIALLPGVGAAHRPRPRRPRSAHGRASRVPTITPISFPSPPAPRSRAGAARRRAEDGACDRPGTRASASWAATSRISPSGCAEIYDPPAVLYVRGRLVAGEGDRAVAVVGSRAASAQGLVLARAMAPRPGRGRPDHRVRARPRHRHRGPSRRPRGTRAARWPCSAPASTGSTRRRTRDLAAAIARDGAVVSEFPLGASPDRKHFPRRNRLIAGWGRAVVVVEAAEKSGALLTAHAALEEGREVMAVPGHPSHPGSAGTNQLIRDGAALVRDARDVAEELGVDLPRRRRSRRGRRRAAGSRPRRAATAWTSSRRRCGRALPELLSHLTDPGGRRQGAPAAGAALRHGARETRLAKNLVIVESPAKAKTINKYLGKDFTVKASMGHVRDLPKKKLGVDVKKGFAAEYEVLAARKKVLDELKAAAKDADDDLPGGRPRPRGRGHLLAPRRGAAAKKAQARRKVHRVVFNEITKRAIEEAFKNPREVDQKKVDAQQARRILDRLVGYKVSPILWDKVRRGLSAGRVQSVALRLICEREREIRAFVPEEYWTVAGPARGPEPAGLSRPTSLKRDGKNARDRQRRARRRSVAPRPRGGGLRGRRRSRPGSASATRCRPSSPRSSSRRPSRKLRFPVKKTMQVAQRLYEGIELGPGRQRRPHHLHAHRLHPHLRRRARRGARAASRRPTARTTCPRSRTSTRARRTRRTPTRRSGRPTSTATPSRSSASSRRTSSSSTRSSGTGSWPPR